MAIFVAFAKITLAHFIGFKNTPLTGRFKKLGLKYCFNKNFLKMYLSVLYILTAFGYCTLQTLVKICNPNFIHAYIGLNAVIRYHSAMKIPRNLWLFIITGWSRQYGLESISFGTRDQGVRTRDLRVMKPPLCQLSHRYI